QSFIHRSRIEAPAAEVYAWHALPDALEHLTPPGEHIEVIERTGGIERGSRVVLRFGGWPFRRRWVAENKVEYALPFGLLGRWVASSYIRRKLEKMFEHRHTITARLIADERSPRPAEK